MCSLQHPNVEHQHAEGCFRQAGWQKVLPCAFEGFCKDKGRKRTVFVALTALSIFLPTNRAPADSLLPILSWFCFSSGPGCRIADWPAQTRLVRLTHSHKPEQAALVKDVWFSKGKASNQGGSRPQATRTCPSATLT